MGQADGPKNLLGFRNRLRFPIAVHPALVPTLGQFPALFQIKDRPAGKGTTLAPVVDGFFRPEVKDRRSGVADVDPEIAGPHSEMNESVSRAEVAVLDPELHRLARSGA